jgi:H+-transporting ATPase
VLLRTGISGRIASLTASPVSQGTQVVGTLAAVYGWVVEPIGWGYALLVWGGAVAWFLVNSGCKILAYRLLQSRAEFVDDSLVRVETSLG